MAVGGRWITFPSIGGDIDGFLAVPEGGKGPWPTIVIAHENIGIPATRELFTCMLAENGYVALTVNLYSRIGGRPPVVFTDQEDRRTQAFLNASDDQAVPDVLAGLRALSELPDADTGRAGIVGFCMGGGTAIAASLLGDAFKASVVLYALPHLPDAYAASGRSVDRVAQAPAIRCPTQFHFGADDEVIPLDQVEELRIASEKCGHPTETFIYDDAGHAFHDHLHPNHNAEASAQVDKRMLDWFGKYLVTDDG